MIDSVKIIASKLAAKTQASSPNKVPKEEKKDFNGVLNNFTESKKISKDINVKKNETEKKPLESIDIESINVDELSLKDALILLQFFLNQNNTNIPHEEMSINFKDSLTSKEEILNLSSIVHTILSDKALPNEEEIKDNNPIVGQLVEKIEKELEIFIPKEANEDMETTKIFNAVVESLKDEKNVKEDEVSKVSFVNEDMGINTIQKLKIDKSLSENNLSKGKDNPEIREEKILSKLAKDKGEDIPFKPIHFMTTSTNNVEISTENINTHEVVVNRETMADDIIKAVRFMDNGNLKNLTVKINPKELGEMVISVVMEDGKLKASVTASNKEAYNLVNANLNEINNKLENSQIKVQNFTLNLYEDATFFKGENNQEKWREDRKEQKNKKISSIGEVLEMDTENHSEDLRNVNILA